MLNDTQILDYLEENGGQLFTSYCKTKFPDGNTQLLTWQYHGNYVGILCAKGVREAIQSHFESKQEFERIQKTKKEEQT